MMFMVVTLNTGFVRMFNDRFCAMPVCLFYACVCALACSGSSAEIGLKASSIINVIAFRVGSNVP